MLGETGCDGVCFPVHGAWNSEDVSNVIVSKSISFKRSTYNGAHDTERLLLYIQVSGDFFIVK